MKFYRKKLWAKVALFILLLSGVPLLPSQAQVPSISPSPSSGYLDAGYDALQNSKTDVGNARTNIKDFGTDPGNVRTESHSSRRDVRTDVGIGIGNDNRDYSRDLNNNIGDYNRDLNNSINNNRDLTNNIRDYNRDLSNAINSDNRDFTNRIGDYNRDLVDKITNRNRDIIDNIGNRNKDLVDNIKSNNRDLVNNNINGSDYSFPVGGVSGINMPETVIPAKTFPGGVVIPEIRVP